MTEPNRVTVVGVGNLLLRDEGIGVHVARILQAMDLPDVEVIDGGTSPDVLACLEPTGKLIIVDAAETGGEPGTIYCFRPKDLADAPSGHVSLHELGVVEELKMMTLLGNTPDEVVIIGVQPKQIEWGPELSPELAARVPEIVKIILEEIGR